MKNLLQKTVLLLLCLPLLQLQAKDVYGFMTGNGKPDEIPIGMYKFDSETHQREALANMMVSFWGGAFAGNTYYLIYSSDYQGYIYNGLGTFDLESHQIGAVDASQPYQCSDMTYDVTTGTMYGIQIQNGGEPYPSTLITIDLKNGMKTNIAETSTPIAAIACNNWGELYAMGKDGNLYAMDKASAELSLIGSTGIVTDRVQAQSMEFDRETGILYWTCLNNLQDALIVKLDIYSSTPVIEQKIMMDNALIAGLHIPMTPIAPQAPAAVGNLQVKGTSQQATLSWVNPSTTYAGQTLNQLSKIEIVRNNKLIHTIDAPAAGSEMSWTDTDTEGLGGNVRYVVYAYNEAGKSESVSKKLIVGDDIPGQVTDFKVTAEGKHAHLSWTAPSVGKNGGSLTASNLRYTLTRMPDKKVFNDISGTSFVDETIEATAYYHYILVCHNKTGEGNPTESEATALGLPIEVPYATDFSTETLAAQWKVIDANNDRITWTWSKGTFVYSFNFNSDGDDHLVSVPFHLEKEVNYAVKYTVEAPSLFSNPEHLAVKVGDQVIEDLGEYNNKQPEERTVSFTVSETGNYEFTFSALSPKDNWKIVISRFAVEKMVSKDLAVSDLATSTDDLQEGTPVTVSAKITNKGIEDIHAYEVQLTDQNKNVIATQTISKTLKKGEEKVITFEWTPTKDVKEITVSVVLDGDNVAGNNTDKYKVYVLGKEESYLSFSDKTSTPGLFPFAFEGKKYSYSQAIYRQDELNMASATFNGICYDYKNSGAELAGKHIKIYLANTEYSRLMDAGWFAEVDMTLVFDGIVDFERGNHTLRLVFEEPFVYNGQNLAIYTQKLDDDAKGDIRYYAKNYNGQEAITAIYYDNNADVSLNLVQGSTMLNHITFRAQNVDTAIDNVTAGDDNYGLCINSHLLSLSQEVDCITVYDIHGKLIAKKHNATSVDLSDCAQGVYLVNVINGNDQLVKKVVKK